MSELSYLEKLMDGVEVEWKAVGDIAGYSTTKVDADKLDATSFVGVDNLLADKGGRIDATYQPNTARLTAYEPGDILLGNIRPYLKKVWMAENNGGCSGDVLAIRILADCKKIISPEYLYYALSSDSFFSYSMQHAKGAKMPRGSKDAILNYQIPIPCPSAPEKSLAIQSEIVRILDKFTALTAELTAELTMRKKQYNYYRDQLLSFKDGEVEWKTLGEVAQYSKTRISFELLDERNYVGVDNLLQNRAGKSLSNHVPTSGKLTEFIPNDILIGNIRPYLKKIWQADCIGGTNGDVLVIRCIDSSINTRYLYQILADDKFFEYNMQHAKGAKMPRGSKEDIMKYPIPVPPLTLQARIVEILNKFDTLTNSITEGLPREIELRQKQYEYYRDLLFSFPKPETASN
ncbi:TPA: restriction endonuclease subunit S [Escherichia coli]|uniref:restriction endonuclease subunit S n=1 Tax=Escherichia coli TaxID=562 RepID=UPI00192983D8|nr:restriction endonuclease subunit S [Escherichia coli]EIQ9633514.1 restriction endonuclease subunit S [Escherichia coli]EKO1170362.1 restriction endonuclease subunit S [Escherichia coli]EMB0767006.1 restriction endonuclease subunit S [Escherichia coli]MBL3987814.1 restriction endonuclease subunit S [Escherichia coli]HBH4750117.1 restriction endonuclease subunit S [Escherichia coli]